MSSESLNSMDPLSTVPVHKVRGPFFRERHPLRFVGPGLTKQAEAQSCDINHIMARWQKTGVLEHVRQAAGNYGDFTSAVDYHNALNQILAAESAFDSLPSSMRDRFRNSPAEFLNFVNDPENADEMVSLGLRMAPKEPVLVDFASKDAFFSALPGGAENPPKGGSDN